MTPGSTPQPGSAGASRGELEDALTSYSGFLAHQLAELALLLSGSGDAGPGAGARVRLERMLADLRDLQAVPAAMEDVDLAALAADVAAELGEPGRRARVGAAGPVLPVHGDPALLGALFGHLLRLGLAASPAAQRFTLSTSERADGRVQVQVLEAVEGTRDAVLTAQRLVPFARPAGSGALLGAGVSGPAAARIVAAHGGTMEIAVAAGGVLTSFDLPAAGA